MKRTLLEARQITHGRLLRGIHLSLREGSLVAILARPGPGPGQLLRILALLEEPESGQLYLEYRLMTGLPAQEREEARLRLVGFDRALQPRILLAQEPTNLNDLLGQNARGQTILYTTSDPVAAAAAHEVYRLRDGALYRLNDTNEGKRSE